MRKLFICVLVSISLQVHGAIYYNLNNADTKIIKYIDERDVCRGWYGKTFVVDRIIIEDINHDGIDDLIFGYLSMYVLNSGWYITVGFPIFMFFGRNRWESSVEEDNADIKIISSDRYRWLAIASEKIAHISDLGDYMVILHEPAGVILPTTEQIALIPINLLPGTYFLDDLLYKTFIGLDHCPDVDFPICAPNITILDTFLVMWGVDEFDSIYYYPVSVNFLMMIPYSVYGDTIDVYPNAVYKAYHFCRRTIDYYFTNKHTIYIPGDVNGDGFEEILLVKTATDFFPQSVNSMCEYTPIAWRRDWIFYSKFIQTHILWGRPTWEGYSDIICFDTFTTRYSTILHDTSFLFPSVPAEEESDLDNDGYADIIISGMSGLYNIAGRGDTIDTTLFEVPKDTSKLYIIFGRPDFPRMFRDSINHLADIIIKSRHNSDGVGGPISVGDYNGDGYQDILTCAPSIYPEIGFVFLGNPERRYPEYFDQADIIIKADSQFIYQYTHNILYSTIYPTTARLADINGDSLDDIILSYVRYRYRNLYPPEWYPLPLLYIFFNRRPTPSLFHPDTNIIDNPHDSICIKLSFKQPLALHTLLLTVSGDTFTIDSPQVRFSPGESLLCFIPSTEWDTSAIIPFCIERLEDTIGTAMRERWCVRFNDTTWNVCQPPKPHTLSLVCYPNPFNAEVRIKLRMPDAGDAKIDIYDISGKLIDHIHKSKLTAGWHELVWCPRISVPSGVYLLKVSAGGEAVVRRVVLMR